MVRSPDELLNHLGPHMIVLADKAYDADSIRTLIEEQGATPNIPAKSNRKLMPRFSKRLYREGNLIERFFSKLKHVRRVATRYDKLAENFLAMVQLDTSKNCRILVGCWGYGRQGQGKPDVAAYFWVIFMSLLPLRAVFYIKRAQYAPRARQGAGNYRQGLPCRS